MRDRKSQTLTHSHNQKHYAEYSILWPMICRVLMWFTLAHISLTPCSVSVKHSWDWARTVFDTCVRLKRQVYLFIILCYRSGHNKLDEIEHNWTNATLYRWNVVDPRHKFLANLLTKRIRSVFCGDMVFGLLRDDTVINESATICTIFSRSLSTLIHLWMKFLIHPHSECFPFKSIYRTEPENV